MNKRKRLRELIMREEILLLPLAHDALTAKLIERAGFEAFGMGGFATSSTLLGRPDVGLLTFSEMVGYARNLVAATTIPMLADADTGYGNVTNVMRTVSEYERAGVAGLLLEDQVSPKRCGHMAGKEVIPRGEMVGKIRAALRAREDPELLIVGRTDARAPLGLKEAIERGRAYAEAGADMIFVEALETPEEMAEANAAIPAPTLANMVERGRSPLLPARELQALGFAAVAYPITLTLFIAKGALELLCRLREEASNTGLLPELMPFDGYNELVGLGEIRRVEEELTG